MKRLLFIAIASLLLLTGTASAGSHHPTKDELKQFLADTTCSASGHSLTCTNAKDGSYLKQLPDGTLVIVGPSTSQGQIGRGIGCEDVFHWGVACPMHSTAEDSFYHGANVTTKILPGGKVVQVTCTRSSATLDYTGRTSGVGAIIDHLNPDKYDLSTSGPTTTDGAC